MMQKKVHLEIIRFIAACLVVFNHTDGYFLYFSETDNILTYLVSLTASIVCKINVPLFFMVTGALLLKNSEDIKTLLQKRVLRIAVVIVLFSAVQYAALGIRDGFAEPFGAADFAAKVYSGSVIEPYWFLYSYLAILLIMPFLRKMAADMGRTEFRYLLILQIVIGIGGRLIAAYTGYMINLSLFVLADNVFYVLLGYYMECIMPEDAYSKKGISKAVLTAVLSIVLSAAAIIGEYKITGAYTQNLLGIFNPILVITVYYLVKAICSQKTITERCSRIFIYLGSTVFGIYLIEQLVRRQLLPVYLYLCEHSVGLVACFVYVAGTILVSIIYVSILKKIPGIRKLL